jgi:hypothetical protein
VNGMVSTPIRKKIQPVMRHPPANPSYAVNKMG